MKSYFGPISSTSRSASSNVSGNKIENSYGEKELCIVKHMESYASLSDVNLSIVSSSNEIENVAKNLSKKRKGKKLLGVRKIHQFNADILKVDDFKFPVSIGEDSCAIAALF